MKYYCAWCGRFHVKGKVFSEHRKFAVGDPGVIGEAEKLFADFLRNFHVLEKRYELDLPRDLAIALTCQFAKAGYRAWIVEDENRAEIEFLGRRVILTWGGEEDEEV